MKRAFTLSEVLITLGIIGIVAAMTMPVLVGSSRKSEIESKLKKVYSVVNQAVNISMSDGRWTMPPTYYRYDNNLLNEWLQTALFKYLNKTESFRNSNEFNHPLSNYMKDWPGIILSDGTILWFNNNAQIHVSVDINGTKGPNKQGVDLFNFFLDFEDKRNLGNFYPSGYAFAKKEENADKFGDIYVYGNREKMIQYCSDKKLLYGNSGTCALLIMNDGWRVSEDYPIRL